MTKSRKRKRVHRVVRGKPKPGHIVAHNRRRRKGEILCHNHVLYTAATADAVHGFHWFTVWAPAGWDPGREEWQVCPCGWRPELGTHYAKAGHVQWWREEIKERGSLGAVYREVRRRQRQYGDTDMGYCQGRSAGRDAGLFRGEKSVEDDYEEAVGRCATRPVP